MIKKPLFCKPKRYLSGIDWHMGYLDYTMKKETSAGNMFQIVMTMNSHIDEKVLREKLNGFTKAFPILCGKFARNYFNLVPYWSFDAESRADRFTFDVYNANDCEKDQALFPILEKCINRPFKKETCHLAFYLIHSGAEKSSFAMVCDHRLFDARGAESFLSFFLRYCDGEDIHSIFKGVSITAPSGLSQWTKKFQSGKTVNRMFIDLSEKASKVFPANDAEHGGKIRFRHIAFSNDQTSRIMEKAYKEAGFLMDMPYLLACTTMVMHKLFASKDILGSSYLVPLTTDGRTRQNTKEQLFFNYVSFFFLQFPVESASDRKELIRLIKLQWYKHVQNDFPKTLLEATALMRIAPFPLLDKFMGFMNRDSFSFSFSYLGENWSKNRKFMGAEIESIFHMPRIPTSPGIGIFMNRFGGRLHAVFSWLDGIVQEEDITAAEKELMLIL